MASQVRTGQEPDSPRRTSLRRLRFNAGLSQEELALAAGVTRQSIVAIESGVQAPTARTAKGIADALGCNVEDFLEELAA